MPYAIWRNTARGTVLLVGFDALEKIGPQRAKDIADLMDRASDAAGLIQEDAIGVKRELYSTVLWHFLADDRLGQSQLPDPENAPAGAGHRSGRRSRRHHLGRAVRKAQGHRPSPRAAVRDLPAAAGRRVVRLLDKGTTDSGATATVFITNKRLLVDTDKRYQTALRNVDEIDVDADPAVVRILTADLKRPLTLRVDEPIYMAAMMDLAASLDERPRGFA